MGSSEVCGAEAGGESDTPKPLTCAARGWNVAAYKEIPSVISGYQPEQSQTASSQLRNRSYEPPTPR